MSLTTPTLEYEKLSLATAAGLLLRGEGSEFTGKCIQAKYLKLLAEEVVVSG